MCPLDYLLHGLCNPLPLHFLNVLPRRHCWHIAVRFPKVVQHRVWILLELTKFRFLKSKKDFQIHVIFNRIIKLNENTEETFQLQPSLLDELLIKVAIESFLRQCWETVRFVLLAFAKLVEQIFKIWKTPLNGMELVWWVVHRKLGLRLDREKDILIGSYRSEVR